MRMEELSNSQYIKSTDTVEKYLLDIIQQYFKSNNIASETSREHIIQKAVARMKEELDFDNLGVLSIIMPNGEVRVGNVTVTLEELGGEPLITQKNSAFNVNFGTEANTACEGNDPRLSDKRMPLAHKHKISDIKNLSNELSTINGKIDRIISHTHDNKDILDRIIYTGTRSSIDLADVEKIEDKVRDLIQQNSDDIARYHDEIDNKIAAVNNDIDALNAQIDDLRQFVINTNEGYKREIIEYTDNCIANANQTIHNEIADLVTKPMLNGIVEFASNAYVLIGTVQVSMQDILQSGVIQSGGNEYTVAADNIISTINALHPVLSEEDVVIQTSIQVNACTYDLPYIVVANNNLQGMISVSYVQNKAIIHCDMNIVPAEVRAGIITVKYYTRQSITL